MVCFVAVGDEGNPKPQSTITIFLTELIRRPLRYIGASQQANNASVLLTESVEKKAPLVSSQPRARSRPLVGGARVATAQIASEEFYFHEN